MIPEVRACSSYPVITAPTGVSKQRRSPVLPMRMLQRPGNSSRKQGTQKATDTGDARIVKPPQSHPVGLVEVDDVIEAGSGLSARLVALHVGPLAPSTLPALLVSVLASALGCPVYRLPDATPRLALLEADAWAVGFLSDGPVGVGDVVTLPVVLDLGQGAPPGAATAHAGGRLA